MTQNGLSYADVPLKTTQPATRTVHQLPGTVCHCRCNKSQALHHSLSHHFTSDRAAAALLLTVFCLHLFIIFELLLSFYFLFVYHWSFQVDLIKPVSMTSMSVRPYVRPSVVRPQKVLPIRIKFGLWIEDDE